MAAKAIVILCAQALFIQSAFSQCFGRGPYAAGYGTYGWGGRNWGYEGLGWGYEGLGWGGRGWGYDGLLDWPARGLGCGPALDITSTSGGSLVVTSASPIPPVGITIVSDNVYEGVLAAAGEVPFVGTTAMGGDLPTTGAGAINYGCGNGVTAMVSETDYPVGGFGAFGGAFAPALSPAIAPALAPAVGGRCGCGRGIVY